MNGVNRKQLVCGAVAALTVIAAIGLGSPANAGPQLSEPSYVPSGPAYSPGRTSLPRPNSYRGAIESRADVRETEIYNQQRRLRNFERMFRSFRELDMSAPGRSYDY